MGREGKVIQRNTKKYTGEEQREERKQGELHKGNRGKA